MKLCIPTNWEGDLIDNVKDPGIESVYGKLQSDVVGGGRPAFGLARVTKRRAKEHIEDVHQAGMRFFYLLNASCMGNKEWTRRGIRKIDRMLNWLNELEVDGIVTASPFLLQYVKKHHSRFRVSISAFAHVDAVSKAIFWEDMGADILTLFPTRVNRDLTLIREIRKHVTCQLQVIANESCIQNCPIASYHANCVSHAAQSDEALGRFTFDYCRLTCRSTLFSDPANFMRIIWIRPEDLHVYEDIGIDRIKLVERTMDTESLSLIARAYLRRSYPGNLFDLFTNPSKSLWQHKTGYFHKLKYCFHPFSVNPFKLMQIRVMGRDVDVTIDNTKLDGFLDHFEETSCMYRSCKSCGHCEQYAKKAVTISPTYREETLKEYQRAINTIVSGDIFRI